MKHPRFIKFAMIGIMIFALFLVFGLAPTQAANTIFNDDFNDGYTGWTASGNVFSDNSPAIVPNSARLKKDGQISRTISTAGYSNISLDWNMAAAALENNEYCYGEYNTGSGWTIFVSLGNGEDDAVFRNGTVNLPASAADNASFQVRYRIQAGQLGDYCYIEDITLSGDVGGVPTSTPTIEPTVGPTPTPTNTPVPGSGVTGDPLTGSGNVTRTVLTKDDLLTGSAPGGTVDNAAFALPANAAHPDQTFEGRLELLNEATSGSFVKVKDSFNYDADAERLHIPEFDFEFVQNGSYLIPVERGNIRTSHPYWTYLIGPGRVWKENSDGGYNRASFPFALLQRNANCTHNGVMMFLFDNSGNVSQVMYQITQETCLYFKGDFSGLLGATYHNGTVNGATQIKTDYENEVANKFPTKSVSQLPIDYPGTDLNNFTSGKTAADLTTWGVVVNGTNYVSDCVARNGDYPYCESMRLPSYSTAKTAFAGVSMARLAQKYGTGVESLLIKDYASESSSSSGDWTSVTLNNTLDMATGNYRFSQYMRDEGSTAAENDFFLTTTHADKINSAFSWPNKATPGTQWVYHTQDTYIATWAMQNYLVSQEGANADIFEMLVNEVFAPINIGPGAYTTLRTSDNNWDGQPFGGFGLWYIQDDVAKIVTLLNSDGGMAGGTQILHPDTLGDMMQQNSADRGVQTTSSSGFIYNNGAWAKGFDTGDGYSCEFYTPFMSGYGGISLIMMPNGVTYYYFSDNDEFSWYDAVQEVNDNISAHCP